MAGPKKPAFPHHREKRGIVRTIYATDSQASVPRDGSCGQVATGVRDKPSLPTSDAVVAKHPLQPGRPDRRRLLAQDVWPASASPVYQGRGLWDREYHTGSIPATRHLVGLRFTSLDLGRERFQLVLAQGEPISLRHERGCFCPALTNAFLFLYERHKVRKRNTLLGLEPISQSLPQDLRHDSSFILGYLP